MNVDANALERVFQDLQHAGVLSPDFTCQEFSGGFSSEKKYRITDLATNKDYLLKLVYNNKNKNSALTYLKAAESQIKAVTKHYFHKTYRDFSVYFADFAAGVSLDQLVLDTKQTNLVAKKINQLLKQLSRQQTTLTNNHFKRVVTHYSANLNIVQDLIDTGKLTDETAITIFNITKTAFLGHLDDKQYLQVGLVHGDFHLGNIVVDKHWKLKLIDYLKASYSFCDKDLTKLCLLNFNTAPELIKAVLTEWFKTHTPNQMKALRLEFCLNIFSYIKNNYNYPTFKIDNMLMILKTFQNFERLTPDFLPEKPTVKI